MIENLQHHETEPEINESAKNRFAKWMRSEALVLLALFGLVVLVWLPRFSGPIDMRWDGGVYYILGTSLAEGKGYKLLNEPGEIDAVQYPPLLPLIIAGHQLILGTDDPTTVGEWLRYSFFILFIVYIYAVFRFFKNHLSLHYAFFATVLCLFSLHVYFLSGLCYPEILFSLVTILFISCIGKNALPAHSIPAYFLAVASYALRTVGLAAFAIWILESLFNKNFKQAGLRLALALIPIFSWQFYIASVESSDEYNRPAYAYQRAPYMFYNVSYQRNVALKEPFFPENGEISPALILRRFVRNAVYFPADLGETVSVSHHAIHDWLKYIAPDARYKSINSRINFWFLYTLGVLVVGGLALQFRHRQWIVPLYVLAFCAAICLTPFRNQFQRYVMPITPFIFLSVFVFLSTVKDASRRLLPAKWSSLGKCFGAATLSLFLLMKLLVLFTGFINDYHRIAYFDKNNRFVEHRLFSTPEGIKSEQDFNLCIEYIRQNADSGDIVAAGNPHWVYLRTGLKAVMFPFEIVPENAQQLLDGVPANYLITGEDVMQTERYSFPVVENFPEKWNKVYALPESSFAVYRRVTP